MKRATRGATRRSFVAAMGFIVLTSLLPAAPIAASGFYSVNSTDDGDDGACDFTHCSLREAISAANADTSLGFDTIELPSFGFSGVQIGITSPLPAITGDVEIRPASSFQPGPPPQVGIVDAGDVPVGLDVQSGAASIHDISIGGFDIGVRIGPDGDGSRLQRNAIGFYPDRFTALANGDGMVIEGDNIVIGEDPAFPSFSSPPGNEIAHNTGSGVLVSGTATGVRINANRIYDNGGLGIDLAPVGADANDAGDVDAGPNGAQNAPVMTQADTLGQISTFGGTIDSTPNTTFRIDVYAVDECDGTGFGEGDAPALSTTATTDGDGHGDFEMGTTLFSAPSGFAAATATAPDGSTSEFSNCFPRTVTVQSDVNLAGTVSANTVATEEPVRYDWLIRNDGPSDATGVTFEQTLPAGVTIGRVDRSQGSCATSGTTVSCSIGNLAAGSFGGPAGAASVFVNVLAGDPGTLATTATIDSTSPDPDATDDTATVNTMVAAPTPQTFVVTNVGDSNDGICDAHCSFREALNAASANPGRDRIEFAVAGTISPTGAWPTIARPVVIDASTAPGYVDAPVVELNAQGLSLRRPISITGGSTEIRGLAVNGASTGIDIQAWGDNTIVGNHIGTNLAGTAAVGTRGSTGVHLGTTANNVVGGPTAAEMNVISNWTIGVHYGNDVNVGGGGSVVQGNVIGLARDGRTHVGNAVGVAMGGPNNVLGGSGPGEGNVISGNTQQAVGDGATASSGNVIQGNIVGLTADQTEARPNGYGIEVNGPAVGTLIGGDVPGAGNVIAGNTREGVFVWNGASGTIVSGNRIGTNLTGDPGLGNLGHGVQIGNSAPGTMIGGTTPAAANVIAFNTKDGVLRDANHGSVLGNSIHSNGELGIDRIPNGVSTTTGSRIPSLATATTAGGSTTVTGTLVSAAVNTGHRIELFGNDVCDPSGNGEGQTFLGAAPVTTNGSGAASFSIDVAALPSGTVVTATSTANNQTSEFSSCITSVTLGPVEEPTPVGTGVVVEPIDFTTGERLVDLTFDNVTGAGETTLVTSTTGPAVPAGLQLGDPATYYEIETTATFDGLVTICITYAGVSFAEETALRLFHFDAGGSAWEDVTTSLDTDADVICGRTDSFSPFAIVAPDFTFSGFFAPVDNLPTLNRAKAGSAIPVRFRLGGDFGLDVFASGFPISQAITCETGTPVDAIESTVSPGTSTLAYDPATGVYQYAWKSSKGWANSCRKLVLRFADGSQAEARFTFTK